MTNSSRSSRSRRPRRQGGGASAPPRPLGDPTAIASPPELTAFNDFLAGQEAAAAAARRVKSLESAKDKAAAALRDAQKGNAGRDAVAEAEAGYRNALEALQAAKEGREVEEPAVDAAGGPVEDDTAEPGGVEDPGATAGSGDEAAAGGVEGPGASAGPADEAAAGGVEDPGASAEPGDVEGPGASAGAADEAAASPEVETT